MVVVKVSASWVTGKQAVIQFHAWCTAMSWVFNSIDTSNDFGIDAYVYVSDDSGTLTGETFSVQLKGGESWSAANGYRIPVGNHRAVWANSPVPVVGIVHDPRDGRLRWTNLTAALREDPEVASVHVPGDALLDDDRQVHALLESIRVTARSGLPTALGSDAVDEQEAAVWDCLALAQTNPTPLIAVRRCFLALAGGGRVAGLTVLAMCTPHPDFYRTKQALLPVSIRRAVSASMHWTVPEMWQLLELIDPETGFDRGSIGQSVFMLVIEDPDAREIARKTAVIAAHDAPLVASWAAAIYLHLVGENGADEWERLCAERPELTRVPLAEQFTSTLRDFGYLALM